VTPQEAVGGFSVETIVGALGGTPEPLIDAIKAGKIRGAVGIVGCNNPKIKHDYGHVTLTRRLIENDILVVDTGCVAVATAKAGFKLPEAADMAGTRASRRSAGTGHSAGAAHGQLCGQRAHPGADLRPGRRPGGGHQRSARGRLGAGVVFGKGGDHRRLFRGLGGHHPPGPHAAHHRQHERGQPAYTGLKDVVGATFAVEPDPEKAAVFLRRTIEDKRKALGLDARSVE
jgi:carbon-monoxide dehydrogenase catalytic subunit